jgi:two-component system, LytTR family, sensor histidine kinase AlgZ
MTQPTFRVSQSPFDMAVSPGAGSAFDVCHVGVVLRSVLFVHAVLAVGLLFRAHTPLAWLTQLSAGAMVVLPGVLLWLVLMCVLKRLWVRLSVPVQWGAAVMLGGLSAAFGFGLTVLANGELGVAAQVAWAGPVVAGMAMAAALFYGLMLRARSRLPADTHARLAELQSRIRPHFLFNTLNTAIALVRLDPARAERLLEDLAELFRVALNETGESVSLADEVALARRYLAIEQVRFGERLHVRWELDAAAGAARVPSLLLQPLVENAVHHGVEPALHGGQVLIKTTFLRGRVLIEIANSVPVEASTPGHGMALTNVRERLRLMHDVAAQFEVVSDGQWFRVNMVVPL